jgi:hypothetical protein
MEHSTESSKRQRYSRIGRIVRKGSGEKGKEKSKPTEEISSTDLNRDNGSLDIDNSENLLLGMTDQSALENEIIGQANTQILCDNIKRDEKLLVKLAKQKRFSHISQYHVLNKYVETWSSEYLPIEMTLTDQPQNPI